ncbi:hypothetical protein FB446DRAFT_782980 [Lentinula raphanica]|nr:hypothetical protein FB446DRAFT_782980 [Lentinula raphanica]
MVSTSSFAKKILAVATILGGAFSARATPMSSRQSAHGVLSAPTNGLVVAEGTSFPFEFQDSNWCEDGYSQISVWLTDYVPTTSNLNSTGQFPEGEYDYYFGSFLIPNFGLPVLAGSVPPPSSLVLPPLTGLNTGDEVYLAVVETGTACPPGINVPPQYEVTSLAMTVG